MPVAGQPAQARPAPPGRGKTQATPAYVAPTPLKVILGAIGEPYFAWVTGAMYTSG